MSAVLVLGCLWAIAASVTALLPMRRQIVPGLALLLSAPVLIGFLASEHGAWVAALGAVAFLSMFRRPLAHLGRKALGRRGAGE